MSVRAWAGPLDQILEVKSLISLCWSGLRFAGSFWKRKRTLLVLGLPGAGKSTLVDYCCEIAPSSNYRSRTVSYALERTWLITDKYRYLFLTVPGRDLSARAQAIGNELSSKKRVDGVIYVSANGFATPRGILVEQVLQESFQVDSMLDYRTSILEQEREDFANVVEILVNYFHRTSYPKWLLIVLSKADLYWQERDSELAAVKTAESRFALGFRVLREKLGSKQIDIDSCVLASQANPFDYLDEQELSKASQDEILESVKRFVGKLEEMASHE